MLRRFTHTLLRGCGRGVKTQANELRSGQVLIIDGKLLEVVKAEHTQGQGRMSGHVQLEARDLRSGSKRVERLRPSDTVERVLIARQTFTFLYNDGRAALLMHPDTFEQVSVPHALFNGMERFLQEGGSVDVASVDGDGEAGEVVQATLPDTIQAVIKSTAASMKNERTDGKAMKAAILDCGAELLVPNFVNIGDTVILRPSTSEFIKRVL